MEVINQAKAKAKMSTESHSTRIQDQMESSGTIEFMEAWKLLISPRSQIGNFVLDCDSVDAVTSAYLNTPV